MSWASRFCPKIQSNQPLSAGTQREEPSLNPYLNHSFSYQEGEIAYEGEYWKIDQKKFQEERWEQKLKKNRKAAVRYFELRPRPQPKHHQTNKQPLVQTLEGNLPREEQHFLNRDLNTPGRPQPHGPRPQRQPNNDNKEHQEVQCGPGPPLPRRKPHR